MNMSKNKQVEKPDRLSDLIQQFRIEAIVLKNSLNHKLEEEGEDDFHPNLFIIKKGKVGFVEKNGFLKEYGESTLVYFPRSQTQKPQVMGDTKHVSFMSAAVDTGGKLNPFSMALPDVINVELNSASSLKNVSDILLEEVFSPRCGGQAVIDRLCEILMIKLLRYIIEEGDAKVGLVAGLAHPNLSHAIVAIHSQPEKAWHLEDFAAISGMSRSQFATVFRNIVGTTPGEYLSNWRLTLARMELSKGVSLKAVVRKVGFSSSSSLSRAYKRQFGISPRQNIISHGQSFK